MIVSPAVFGIRPTKSKLLSSFSLTSNTQTHTHAPLFIRLLDACVFGVMG